MHFVARAGVQDGKTDRTVELVPHDEHPVGSLKILPPVHPQVILNAGANYPEHAAGIIEAWHKALRIDGAIGRRYIAELKSEEAALDELREAVRGRTVTLLTATKELDLSHATVLRELLDQ